MIIPLGTDKNQVTLTAKPGTKARLFVLLFCLVILPFVLFVPLDTGKNQVTLTAKLGTEVRLSLVLLSCTLISLVPFNSHKNQITLTTKPGSLGSPFVLCLCLDPLSCSFLLIKIKSRSNRELGWARIVFLQGEGNRYLLLPNSYSIGKRLGCD